MKNVHLILFPKFQMLAYVLATETLRLANKCAGTQVVSCQTLTSTNAPVVASNGATVVPEATDWSAIRKTDLVLLCAGYDPLANVTARCRAFLARMNKNGATLGGVDSGTMILADLGLMDGYRTVLHHDAEGAFREAWPDIAVSDQIYCLDGPRLTTAGGMATSDAMLAWIAQSVSPGLSGMVSDAMVHGPVRASDAPQRPAKTVDPLVLRMRAEMMANLGAPIHIAALAGRLGVSTKQLRRHCKKAFGISPSEFYLRLRLEEAHGLLTSTNQSVNVISEATGFTSPSAFSRAFKARYIRTPREHRSAPSGV